MAAGGREISPRLVGSGTTNPLAFRCGCGACQYSRRIKKNRDGENETPIHYKSAVSFSSYRRFSGQDRSIILWSPREWLQISHACLIGWSSSRSGGLHDRPTTWLSRKFGGLFCDWKRGSIVSGQRPVPPCLESLESRTLLSNASGVWSFVHHAAASSDEGERTGSERRRVQESDLRRAVRSISQLQRTGWRHRPADHGRRRESDLVSVPLPVTTASKYSISAPATLFGKPVLIWWQGTIAGIKPSNSPAGTPLSGNFVIYNQHYQKIMTILRTGRSGIGPA